VLCRWMVPLTPTRFPCVLARPHEGKTIVFPEKASIFLLPAYLTDLTPSSTVFLLALTRQKAWTLSRPSRGPDHMPPLQTLFVLDIDSTCSESGPKVDVSRGVTGAWSGGIKDGSDSVQISKHQTKYHKFDGN